MTIALAPYSQTALVSETAVAGEKKDQMAEKPINQSDHGPWPVKNKSIARVNERMRRSLQQTAASAPVSTRGTKLHQQGPLQGQPDAAAEGFGRASMPT
jgi:hypothetical protein